MSLYICSFFLLQPEIISTITKMSYRCSNSIIILEDSCPPRRCPRSCPTGTPGPPGPPGPSGGFHRFVFTPEKNVFEVPAGVSVAKVTFWGGGGGGGLFPMASQGGDGVVPSISVAEDGSYSPPSISGAGGGDGGAEAGYEVGGSTLVAAGGAGTDGPSGHGGGGLPMVLALACQYKSLLVEAEDSSTTCTPYRHIYEEDSSYIFTLASLSNPREE